PRPPALFPYTTLFRSQCHQQRELCFRLHSVDEDRGLVDRSTKKDDPADLVLDDLAFQLLIIGAVAVRKAGIHADLYQLADLLFEDRKSTRLNSSHVKI